MDFLQSTTILNNTNCNLFNSYYSVDYNVHPLTICIPYIYTGMTIKFIMKKISTITNFN